MRDNNIIRDAINYIKRLNKENAELKVHIKDRDEYISSLLLSLFLMQGEVDRLNKTLDLARKGELVYINNPQVAELKAENARLKERIIKLSEENGNLIIRANTCSNNYRDTQRRLDELCKANIHNLALLSKANKTLQEIKEIAETPKPFIDNLEIKSATEVEYDYAAICNELELRLHKVLELITKSEREG